MMWKLVITVTLHENRYHGTPEWPPSALRLFQALVAAAAQGALITDDAIEALRWLERLAPPAIVAPRHRNGQEVKTFVPLNDLDAKGGEPRKVADIRAAKQIRPKLLQGQRFHYAWSIPPHTTVPSGLPTIVKRVYQFGRGVDIASADLEVISANQWFDVVATFDGELFELGGDTTLAAPVDGTVHSLVRRYQAASQQVRESARPQRASFYNPPKPVFQTVGYDVSPASLLLYELREQQQPERLYPWRLDQAVELVTTVRDQLAARLTKALPELSSVVDYTIVGRVQHDVKLQPSQRVRLIPLPSVGHQYADPSVRRVAVMIPSDCVIQSRDIAWALSGLRVGAAELVRSEDRSMLQRYLGSNTHGRGTNWVWQSITPVALPHTTSRSSNGAAELLSEQDRATHAIWNALRHAGVKAHATSVKFQREPFRTRGAHAESFATPRFDPRRLWHVEIEFNRPVRGPLVIGDGRFLGLGVLLPVRSASTKLAPILANDLGDQA